MSSPSIPIARPIIGKRLMLPAIKPVGNVKNVTPTEVNHPSVVRCVVCALLCYTAAAFLSITGAWVWSWVGVVGGVAWGLAALILTLRPILSRR